MSAEASSQAQLADLLRENDRLFRSLEKSASRRDLATVYFIRCEQYVKIGISTDPAWRLKQVRTGGGSLFPRRLDIETAVMLATEPGGIKRERELHRQFAHLRHTGEWFTEAPELTEYINALDAAA